MLNEVDFYRDIYGRALELFQQRRREGPEPQGLEGCWLVAQQIGDECHLKEAARAWLAKELLVGTIVRETLKERYRRGGLTSEGLGETLDEEVRRASARLPEGIKETLFASLLKEQCASLLRQLHERIHERLARRGTGGPP